MRSAFLRTGLVLLTSWAVTMGTAITAGGQTGGGAVERQVVDPIFTGDKDFVLHFHHTAHMPSSMARRGRFTRRADTTLVAASGDYLKDLKKMVRMAAAQGVDAIINNMALPLYLEAAEGTEVGIIPMINTGSLGSRHWKIDSWKPVYKRFREFFGEHYDHPGLYRKGGKVVIGVFRAGNILTPDDWREVKAALRNDGYETMILPHFQPHRLLRRKDTEERLRGYVDALDGLLSWRTGEQTKRKILPLYRKMIDQFPQGDKYFFILESTGYWRPEKGWWTPKRGTREFREQLRLAMQLGNPDAIGIESWDDYSENHHIQPSMENHTAVYELTGYLLGNHTAPTSEARILLSYRKEVRVGETLEVEALLLPCEKDVSVRLDLRDGTGRELRSYPAQVVKAGRAEALIYRFPTGDLAERRAILPVVQVEGAGLETRHYEGAGAVRLRTGRMQVPYTRHVSLHKIPELATCSLSIAGAGAGEEVNVSGEKPVEIVVDSPRALRRVEVIKNNMFPVYSYASDRARGDSEAGLGIAWSCPLPGLPEESYNYAGHLDVENGEFLEAHTVRPHGAASVESPQRLAWNHGNTVRINHVACRLRTNDDTVFRLTFPGYDREMSFSWTELNRVPFLEYTLSSHSSVKVRRLHTATGMPEKMNAKRIRDQFVLRPDSGEPPVNMYTLRVVDDQNNLYRTPPVWVRRCSEKGTRNIRIWDEERGAARTVPARQCDLDESFWPMEEGAGRYAFDRGSSHGLRHLGMGGWGFAAELGGSYLRDGGYDPAGEPEWVSAADGRALKFAGDDRLYFSPRVLPQGEFTFEMNMQPERFGKEMQVLISAAPGLWMRLLPSGRVQVLFRTRHAGRLALASEDALETGRWHHLAVVFNLETLTLYIDGKRAARTDKVGGAAPFMSGKMSYLAHVGADRSGSQQSGYANTFEGLIESMYCVAYALRAENFRLLPRLPE